jgi:large subunit ribosomal protein L6
MSRVGKRPISIPDGIDVRIEDDLFVAEGPKGKVTQKLVGGTSVEIQDGEIRVARSGDSASKRARHGLMRALLANAVEGVANGFSKGLEIVGVGYRAELKGQEVHFALGYSHPVVYSIPDGIQVEVEKNTKLTVRGADRQKVGQVAAEIRKLRRPDAYKGKGMRYAGESVRRKVGKAGV